MYGHDKVFCSQKACKNKCGHKMTEDDYQPTRQKAAIYWQFCESNGEVAECLKTAQNAVMSPPKEVRHREVLNA